MDIYIMPQKKCMVSQKKIIYLKDIADVYSADFNVEEIKNTIIFKVPDVKSGIYSVSVIDIVQQLLKTYKNAQIINEGEAEVLIEYNSKKPKESKFLDFFKIAFISLILFSGGTTAIMSFHTDGEVPKIMQGYYKIFTGEENENPYILEIPYSIGLSVGIILFFNHFCGKKMSFDPTPIEVQLTTYEEQVIKDQLHSIKKMENKDE